MKPKLSLLLPLSFPSSLISPISLTLLILSLHCLSWKTCHGLDNGLALTPPMGWMSWVRYACETDCSLYPKGCINEDLYKEMADMMADEGYKEVGYQYVNIDDCWSEMKRHPQTNKLLPNQQRFPDGIPALSDYVHSKGLKFGKHCKNVTDFTHTNPLSSSQRFSLSLQLCSFPLRF
jgi:hypothetical protein